MPISYPLVVGTSWVGYESITLKMMHVTSLTESPYTFKQQVVRHPGMVWGASLKLPPVNKDLALDWVAFLGKLRGRFGTFTLSPPNGLVPRGLAATSPGTPLVNGAAQVGDTLNIDGCGASKTNYLREGDFIQLGTGLTSRLYMVLDDTNTNGSGQASLTVWPDISPSPADNAAVVLTNPAGLFRLASDTVSWTETSDAKYTLSFDAKGVV